jgi:hypothetical protein
MLTYPFAPIAITCFAMGGAAILLIVLMVITAFDVSILFYSKVLMFGVRFR